MLAGKPEVRALWGGMQAALSEHVFQGPMRTTPEELQTEVSLWKCIKASRPNYAGGIFKRDQYLTIFLDSCLWNTWSEKSHDYRDAVVFEKPRFQKCFPSTQKRKAGVFKFLRFEERLWKAPFSR